MNITLLPFSIRSEDGALRRNIFYLIYEELSFYVLFESREDSWSAFRKGR